MLDGKSLLLIIRHTLDTLREHAIELHLSLDYIFHLQKKKKRFLLTWQYQSSLNLKNIHSLMYKHIIN